MKDKELVTILAKLVSFETTPGKVEEIGLCFDYIDKELSFYPFHKQTFLHNGVESRIWSTSKAKKTEYILNAHIDVVPGEEKLFKLKKAGDKVSGRGVSDMKYSVALYIIALRSLYKKFKKLPSIAIILTSDEEVGGFNGVKHILTQGYRANIAFVPDGGENNNIVENAKGVIQLDIISKGQDAHGARLWEGKDSIEPLIKTLLKIRKEYPFPVKKVWKTTINLGKINGGVQTNQVASQTVASLDIRYVPSEKPVQILKAISNHLGNCSLKENIRGSAFSINRNNLYVKIWGGLLKSKFINEDIASDARHFTSAGITAIVSKPIGGLIHNSGEWSSIASCLNFGHAIEEFLSVSLK
jgi:acetylornithine deacetylase/succinyl-diaminopimelate desuccinylase-like protein